MKLYGIFCAGGFGREVMPLAEAMISSLLQGEKYDLVFIDQYLAPSIVNNYPVISVDDFCSHNADEKYFNVAAASYETRISISKLMLKAGVKPFSIYANNRIELANNAIGEGAIFCPYTTITSNAKIGKFFHANIYSYIAHDCIIGDYVTFAPNVHCNGNVIIEDHAYIGTGAIIKQGTAEKPLVIGKGAIVGMGSVVTKSVLPHQTVVGNPAQLLVRKIVINEVIS